jgi:hypothetical protein
MDQDWRQEILDEREQKIERAAEAYMDNPAGLPGHNLLVVISKMAQLLDEYQAGRRGAVVAPE